MLTMPYEGAERIAAAHRAKFGDVSPKRLVEPSEPLRHSAGGRINVTKPPMRLKLWLHKAFALSDAMASLADSTIASKRRALERGLADIHATTPACDLARTLQAKFDRARDHLLTFADWNGLVELHNNGCKRGLRPAVIQRKVTNGYRAMWAAEGEADVRSVVATARIGPDANVFGVILKTVQA